MSRCKLDLRARSQSANRRCLPLAHGRRLGYKRQRVQPLMRDLLLGLLLAGVLGLSASSQQSQPSASSSAPASKGSTPAAKAQKPAKAAPPDAPSAAEGGKSKPKDGEDKARDYSKEAFVIEKMYSHYRFEADGTGRKETIARIRVQSEAGVQQWGQLQLGYNSANEKVEIGYVRVLKADGSVVKAGEDAVQDLSAPVEREAPVYTDYRQKHVTVPGLRPGEVLEYDLVTVIHTPLAASQFWTEYEFDKNSIVLDEQFDVDVPAARAVKLKNKPDLDPKMRDEKSRRTYHWVGAHVERDDDNTDQDKEK